MKTHKYTLSEDWIKKVACLLQFANGGTQVTVKTKDGKIWQQVLISNSTWIIAMRNYDDLPFSISDIENIYQTEEDENPKECGNWKFWDTVHQGTRGQ